MKRWLAALAVFTACACHVDIAAADARPPTLWQRIVSVFAPRPPVRHPASQHFDNPQKSAAVTKPAAPPPVAAPPQPAVESDVLAALPPEPNAAAPVAAVAAVAAVAPAETSWVAEPFPEEAQPEMGAPEMAQPPAAPAKTARKHEQRKKAKVDSRADTTAALPSSAPVTDTPPVTALAEPSDPPSTIAPGAAAPAQFKPTKKAKHNKAAPGYELASLGSPGLKAALDPENTQPETAPRRFDGSTFPMAPAHGSVCNEGRKVITAYYWEGSHTASGQPFNPHAMTAAHRTLPFGTHLNVTNPRTGKSVEVIVNDRGPYTTGVGLDLSIGAAQAIGLHGTGSVCIL
jgi:rare lipoprotein A